MKHRIILILLISLLPGSGLFAQNVVIDQAMISIAKIRDAGLISFFLESYLIPEEGVIEMHFIDATGNGFGEEDLVKCFPSEKTYYLFPSDTAQAVMNKWQFSSNFQSVTQNASPEVFEQLESDKAQNSVLAELLRSVNRNYDDLPLKLFFERDSNTVVFDMWGYKPESLQYKEPPAPPAVPETSYDLLHTLQSDTLVLSDTTYYDRFYIYRSVTDTLFISEEEFLKETRRQQAQFQPGVRRKK